MGNKKIYINEQRFMTLLERVTDKLWHFTQPSSVLAILKTNKIGCTFAQNKSDAYSKKHPYYICMSRTRTVYDNSWGRSKVARIQFDGQELNKHYPGRPINYYGWSKGDMQERGGFEYEDRIFSNKPFIANADKFITRIDILVDNEMSSRLETCKEILELANQRNIPVYFYGSKADYSRQTDNTINDTVMNYGGNDEPEERYLRRVDFPRVLAELFSIRYEIDHASDEYSRWDECKVPELEAYLSKYGMEEYFKPVLEKFRYSYPNHMLRDACITWMSNNTDIRQAHLISQSPEKGETLQKMMLDLMRECGVKDIESLIWYLLHDEANKKGLQDSVRCVFRQYQGSDVPTLIDGDEPAREYINLESTIERIQWALQDDENYLEPGYEYDGYEQKIHHKSKSSNSLLAYLRRKLGNNCTIYDAADTLIKLFNNNESKMQEELGFSLKSFTLTKDEFAQQADQLWRYHGWAMSDLTKKLFGNSEKLFDYRKEKGIN